MRKRALSLAVLLLASQALGQSAVWIVRDQLASPEKVRELCSDLKAAGPDTMIVQVRGRGDAWYETDLAPRSEEISKDFDFDPLASFLSECEEPRALAWMNAFFVWSGPKPPQSPNHPQVAHPEWVLADSEGKAVTAYTAEERANGWLEGTYVDPASEGYRKLYAQLCAEVARNYQIDGVHLDFIRYPGPAYGFGGELGKKFEEKWGFDPRLLPVTFAPPDIAKWLSGEMPLEKRVEVTGRLLWAKMRADEITKTIRAVKTAVKGQKPALELSAAIFPDIAGAFLDKGQDWRGWVEEGLVDALYPMAYFGPEERVKAQLGEFSRITRSAGVTQIWSGLGAYIKEPTDICKEAGGAYALGFDGVSLFDAGTLRKKNTLAENLKCAGEEPAESGASAPNIQKAPKDPLAYAAYTVAGGKNLPEGWEEAVKKRQIEFYRAAKEVYSPFTEKAKSSGVKLPQWASVRGVFRYLHPLDPPQKEAEQLARAEEARELLSLGGEFAEIAKEFSQWGNKGFGGDMGVRFIGCEEDLPLAAFAKEAGSVGPVARAWNGFWILKTEKAGGGETIPFAESTFAQRRAALKAELLKWAVEPKPLKEGGQ